MTYYPYNCTKEEYIKMTLDSFIEEYPDLSKKHIKVIITDIVNTIDSGLYAKTSRFALFKIGNMRSVLQKPNKAQLSPEERRQLMNLEGNCADLYSYKRGDEYIIKLAFDIPEPKLIYPTDPKQQELLQEFTRNALVTCTKEICDATENAIKSEQTKKSFVERFGGEPSSKRARLSETATESGNQKTTTESSPVNDQSQVMNVDGNQQSSTTQDDEKPPKRQKKEVSFVEKLATKKQPTFPATGK
jgi:hypothetical protein